MEKCISLGSNNDLKLFIYILIYAILNITEMLRYFMNDLSEIEIKLSQRKLFESLIFYVGDFLFLFIYLYQKKNNNSKNNKNKIKKSSKMIKYIFNNPIDDHMTSKVFLFISLICILSLLSDLFSNIAGTRNLIYSLENDIEIYNDKYYFVQIYILYFLSLIFLKTKFYRHQYLSIIIIGILGVSRMIIYKIFFFTYFDVISFIFHIACCLFKSIIYIYLKGLMEYKYYLPSKCSYIFGEINIPIIIVLYAIASFIPFQKSAFCFLEKNNNYYFDNFYSIPDMFTNTFEILYLVYYCICSGVYSYLINFMIYNYSYFHITIFFQLRGFIDNIFYILENSDLKGKIIFLIIISIIFCLEILMSLVFLEVIELNFCGLNKNLKRKIQERGMLDLNYANNNQDSINENSEDGEIEEEEEKKEEEKEEEERKEEEEKEEGKEEEEKDEKEEEKEEKEKENKENESKK